MPDAKGRGISDSVPSPFFLLVLPHGSRFWRCPDCCSPYVFDRRSELLKTCFCWAIAATAAGASTLAIYSLSDPTFLGDLWSIFTFRLGLTQYLPLSARIYPVEGQLETIDSLNVFSSATYFFEAYVVRTQLFCGSLGIVGIFALVSIALRRRAHPNNLFAALLLPLCTVWLGWAALMQGHYIIHEYQMILASPILAIGVACLYSLLDDIRLAAQDSRLRENLAMLTNLALPCALLLVGISAVAITVRGEAEEWHLANLGRRIKAEVPAGAVVITNEMSMVQTYYSERHVIRGVPGGADLESKLGMIQDTCPGCALYLAVRRRARRSFATCSTACSRSLRMTISSSKKSIAEQDHDQGHGHCGSEVAGNCFGLPGHGSPGPQHQAYLHRSRHHARLPASAFIDSCGVSVALGLTTAICIASAKYVINEWLDREDFDSSIRPKSSDLRCSTSWTVTSF